MHSKPSTITILDSNGDRYVGRCLPMIQRQSFLEFWRLAWEKLSESLIANAAADGGRWKAVAYLWDTDEDFRWYCEEMLGLCKIPAKFLDVHQISDLLFFAEDGGGQGRLTALLFPPLPPGATLPPDNETSDPVSRMLAVIAFQNGDWGAAYKALKEIPYDTLVESFYEFNRIHKERNNEPVSAPTAQNPSNIQTEDQGVRLELLRQKAAEMRRQGAVQSYQQQREEALRAMGIES